MGKIGKAVCSVQKHFLHKQACTYIWVILNNFTVKTQNFEGKSVFKWSRNEMYADNHNCKCYICTKGFLDSNLRRLLTIDDPFFQKIIILWVLDKMCHTYRYKHFKIILSGV